MLWSKEKDKKIYSQATIRYSIFARPYKHLPTENPNRFFKTISKTAYDMQRTANHCIIKSQNYILKINNSYEVEEIVYNNQKKDIDNIYERVVIMHQKHNLPELEDLAVYDIKLPERYNEVSYFTKIKPLPKDMLAPTWECPDVTTDKNIKLSDFQGKVVVLNFWGTSCAPCMKFLPKMKELQTEFVGKEIVFVGMAFDKSKENIVKHLEKYAGGVFYTNVLYTEKEGKAYHVHAVPTFFVLDKEHKIIYSHIGTEKAQENLRKYILEALER